MDVNYIFGQLDQKKERNMTEESAGSKEIFQQNKNFCFFETVKEGA